jgi:tRNA pseudouridine38-40 synthase
MIRYLAYCSYIGTNYCGFQAQPNEDKKGKFPKPAVQDSLEAVVSKLNKQKTFVHSSGRTDAKVNVYRMPITFVLNREKELSDETIKKALNYHLDENQDDISILEIKQVPLNFDAKKDVKQKEYVYRIEANLGEIAEYIQQKRKLVWSMQTKLDLDKLKETSQLFVGTRDFKHFTTPAVAARKKLKGTGTIKAVDEIQVHLYEPEFKEATHIQAIELRFKAKSFMKYQVRKMTRAIAAVALGIVEIDLIKVMLEDPDNVKEGAIPIYLEEKAPPHGLFLKDVKYQ